MRIFVISDLHADMPRAEAFSFFLEKEKPDLLLINGDITNIGSFDQMGFARRILEALDDSGVKWYAVPGNNDDADVMRYMDVYGGNIHDSYKNIGKDIGIIGFGGAETPFKTPFEPSNEEQAESLEKHWPQIAKQKCRIFMIHNPPYGIKMDVAGKKHVGSKPARKIIEKLQPELVLTAHIHESPGEDKIGKSKIFYPGAFFQGNYGIIEIDKKTGKVKSLKVAKF